MIGIDLVRPSPPKKKWGGGRTCIGVTGPAEIGWDGNLKNKMYKLYIQSQ